MSGITIVGPGNASTPPATTGRLRVLPTGQAGCSPCLREAFQDISVQEIHPGRLLHVQAVVVKTGLPITTLAVYQHVWRPQENQKLRGEVWDSIRHVLSKTPERHDVLVVAGDMNSSLRPAHPHVGSAASSSTCQNHCAVLQALVAECQLTALNTWHATPRVRVASSGGG